MPLPPDHQRRIGPGARVSRRERRLVQIVGALAALLIVATIVSLSASGPSSGHGCVRATFAGPVGAEQVNDCGAAARRLCATLGTSGYQGDARTTIAGECRKAGLTPVL